MNLHFGRIFLGQFFSKKVQTKMHLIISKITLRCKAPQSHRVSNFLHTHLTVGIVLSVSYGRNGFMKSGPVQSASRRVSPRPPSVGAAIHPHRSAPQEPRSPGNAAFRGQGRSSPLGVKLPSEGEYPSLHSHPGVYTLFSAFRGNMSIPPG
jgi:hypothetical protein